MPLAIWSGYHISKMYVSLWQAAGILCMTSIAMSLPSLASPGNDSAPWSSETITPLKDNDTVATDGVSAPRNRKREIFCFSPDMDSRPTNVDGCRPSLTELRNYESYTIKQAFSTGDYPRPLWPQKPPYFIHPYPSTCNLTIEDNIQNQRAWFSFKDARNLATDILQYCEDDGHGLGGWGLIGEDVRGAPSLVFRVAVFGIDPVRPVVVS